jgi:hypothetical protein
MERIKHICVFLTILFLCSCTKTPSQHGRAVAQGNIDLKDDADVQQLSLIQETLTDDEKLIKFLEDKDKAKTELSLISFDVGNFTDYTPLLAFKNLEFLEIFNYSLTNISGITVLSRHEKLSHLILWAENVTDISPLSALVNLRILSVDIPNIFTDASELLPLVRLEELYFSPTSSKTIYNISQLTWLKTLYINLHNKDIDISPVQNLINLECLEMSGPMYEMTEFDISWMGRLVNLQELKLSGFKIVNVGPLLKLPHLATVNVMFSEISDENIKLLRTTNAMIYTPDYKDR